ncbi:MAG: hypothetical protein JXA18_16620 [Chitinispirillaceae bacterium]|nr:hypothetical protein [Chitinispirillaceae bacterium]
MTAYKAIIIDDEAAPRDRLGDSLHTPAKKQSAPGMRRNNGRGPLRKETLFTTEMAHNE